MVPLCFRRSRILMIKVWCEVMRAANAIISRKEMHYSQKLKLKLLVLILSMYCWRSVCDEAPSCSNEKFNCGSIAYISYPFWGGTRSQDCGREGFQIICDANTPTLTISSLSYRLHRLDFATNSLTLSRQDLFDTACPNLLLLRNTTIDTELFRFPPNSTQLNLNLYYGCTGAPAEAANRLRCGDESVINLFSVGDGAAGIGISCNSSIYVPISSKDAESLKNPSDTSINIVISALNAGFSIQWLNDTKQLASPYCNAGAYAGSCRSGSDTNGRGLGGTQRRLLVVGRLPGGVVSGTGFSSGINTCCYATTAKSDAKPVSSPTISSMAPATSPAPQPAGYGYGLPPVPSSGRYHPNNSRNRHGKKRGKEIVIVVAITAAAIIIVSISMHYFLKRRQSGSGLINPNSKHDVENFLRKHGSLAPRRYKFCELKKITRSFRDKLGEGGYGSVYKGKLADGRPVAVKLLACKVDSSSTGSEDFKNEVASISKTSHVNVVTLLGFCSEGSKRALVYEFMPNSSLDKFLNQSAGAMDLEKLYKIAVGIAKGLEYLHTGCTTRIVHFDIKPQNILLDEDFCPKISDFGLAKLCKKKQSIISQVGTRGTPGYIAPEVFMGNGRGSHKSDVYSYGMLLLKMAQEHKVVESESESEAEAVQSSEEYFPDKIYDEAIKDANRCDQLVIEDEEKETTTKMFVVGFWCIQTNPSTRPSISKVVEMLEGSLKSIQIPPKPMLYEHDQDQPQPLPASTSIQNPSDHD